MCGHESWYPFCADASVAVAVVTTGYENLPVAVAKYHHLCPRAASFISRLNVCHSILQLVFSITKNLTLIQGQRMILRLIRECQGHYMDAVLEKQKVIASLCFTISFIWCFLGSYLLHELYFCALSRLFPCWSMS